MIQSRSVTYPFEGDFLPKSPCTLSRILVERRLGLHVKPET